MNITTRLQRCLATGLPLLLSLAPLMAQDSAPVDSGAMLNSLQAKYGNKTKKYGSLAKKTAKQVKKALSKTKWSLAGPMETLGDHPYLQLIGELTKQAHAFDGKKPGARVDSLLEKTPWAPRLELDIGLDFGSDRPVPEHRSGFIKLGELPAAQAGFSQLPVNQYLYGFREIVGWRYTVQSKRGLSFGGRQPGEPTLLEPQLPVTEELRTQLEGYSPDVALFALPALTHAIHDQLAKRRAADSKGMPALDEALIFMDSQWNGFTYKVPFSKEAQQIIITPHQLLTNPYGFVHQFSSTGAMVGAGDIPFVCDPSRTKFAKQFMGLELTVSDFVGKTAKALKVNAEYESTSAYMVRYKMLIELIAYSILVPDQPYPRYLKTYDFPEGKVDGERGTHIPFDVPRRHAILAWAYADKDPVVLADFQQGEPLV
ncbi:MAG: hypothetical protein JKY61_10245, partial [Planctomycetes bacterium]|nr:hypothetical protein [Planctomycetota bacterium]